MPDPDRTTKQPARETPNSIGELGRHDEPMDEEEKVLAGRADVNMPGLLTRDVLGG